jgi:DNA-binding NtrC family response regulator/tetratricopeptide (TPR) repeat protein
MARARPSSPPEPLDRLVGEAPALQTLRAQIRHLARFDAVGHAAVPTVLLQGETGTGKGLVARVMHDSGPRASGPFIEVNCAAIPETLLEAELFGVEAGAFTDAKRAKPGLFEAASGGTLFLDEIAALPLALQGKCLTVIETKRVRRVGAVVEHPMDVKLIAATQVELSGQVQAGRFRADLYHRLAVVVLELPPLRARGEDILVLARAFLHQYGAAYGVGSQRLSKAAEAWLLDYRWPGNVRELSHLLERVVLLEAATVIDPESLARYCLPAPVPAVPAGSGTPPRPDVPLNDSERLIDALRQSAGNLAAAARLLGVSRGGLRYRLHKYGLTRSSLPRGSALVREETGRKDIPTSSTPTLFQPQGEEPPVVPSPLVEEGQGGGESARRDERRLVLAGGKSSEPTAGWVAKPVAVLAIEATWPDLLEAEAGHYEPWTVASRWEQCLAEKVAGFGGVILQGSASLLLVAFGLPQTLEQLPQRAVQAALALRHLAAEAQNTDGPAAGPAVRLAGHVGTLLVVEETGESPRRWLAVGETLALPVRLLGHAVPGELLVSPPMARLTQGWIEVQARPLSSGVEPSDPLLAYTVVGRVPRQAALAGLGRRARTPLLGRVHELAMLQAVLARVEGGRGQVVGIVGEPGIGKSRLLAEWRQSLAAHEVTYLEGHCWSYGNATPYLPVLDLLRAQCGITPDDSSEVVVEKVRNGLQAVDLAPDDWSPYLLHLLAIQEGIEQLVGVSPELLKTKTFEALRQLSLHLSHRHPLVLAVENLHWIDPTSEAFFASLVERLPAASILFLTPYRPGYQPPWLDKSYATQLTLSPLSPQDSVQVVRAVLPTETIPNPLTQAILAKAQGNPFFLEEITQTLVEQGMRRREGGMSLPSALQLPATVQELLGARIDRLPADEKALLQTMAVIGTVCSRRQLMQIVAQPEAEASQGLANLQAAELLYEQVSAPEPTYTFKHVLTQEVAYHTLSQARQRALHERTAKAIEALVSERLAEHYSELAYHYSRSDSAQKAVVYLQRAGQQAADRSAYHEAITHLTQTVERLQRLPNTPALMRQELDCHITLAQALSVTRGHTAPDAEQAYLRAHALCEQLGDTPQQLVVLGGLRTMYEVRGDLPKARELAEELLRLAQREPDPARLMRAYISAGTTLFQLGEFVPAREYLDQALALEDPQWDPAAVVRLSNQIPGASSRRYAAWTLWYLGYPAQALQQNQEAIALAQALAHPYSLAYALHHVAILHGLRGEAQAAHTYAEALIALAQ